MSDCPICNGRLVERDKYGIVQECEKCATEFSVRAKAKGESKYEPTE